MRRWEPVVFRRRRTEGWDEEGWRWRVRGRALFFPSFFSRFRLSLRSLRFRAESSPAPEDGAERVRCGEVDWPGAEREGCGDEEGVGRSALLSLRRMASSFFLRDEVPEDEGRDVEEDCEGCEEEGALGREGRGC